MYVWSGRFGGKFCLGGELATASRAGAMEGIHCHRGIGYRTEQVSNNTHCLVWEKGAATARGKAPTTDVIKSTQQ